MQGKIRRRGLLRAVCAAQGVFADFAGFPAIVLARFNVALRRRL